ncbi:MAG TPA: ScpA family protein [Solirubrobacterales bacterium]|jgi:segregation and condensation protein A|nr:ScpA family protein [Solirubrobacterales bacterium]
MTDRTYLDERIDEDIAAQADPDGGDIHAGLLAGADTAPVTALSGSTPRYNVLQLDLEVFHGPFDLLLELVMREEIDLLEVDLAKIVLGYVELLEARGEIELEPVTEFVVLIAALLELKSRMMLPRDEVEGGLDLDLGPEEAAEELLARMLEYHRYNKLAGWLRERFVAESPFRYRSAPLPRRLRTATYENVGQVYNGEVLARAVGDMLREPEPLTTPHLRVSKVTLEQRLMHVRTLLKRAGSFDFDDAVAGTDRLTEALTVWALLELYKLGEAEWSQDEAFGPIEVHSISGRAAA